MRNTKARYFLKRMKKHPEDKSMMLFRKAKGFLQVTHSMLSSSQLLIFSLSVDQKLLLSSAACFLNERLFLVPSSFTFRTGKTLLQLQILFTCKMSTGQTQKNGFPPSLPTSKPLFLNGI